jgi:hypothetical protein
VAQFFGTVPKIDYLKGVEGSTPPHDPSPFLFSLMRKIEQQMIAAIKGNTDWKCDNTEVINIEGVSFVYLHGNQIATIDDDSLTLFDGGYQSKTTKSRLNALLSEFGYTCGTKREYVFQKQFEWFVNFVDTKTEQMMTIPFVDGMRLAG